MAEEDTKRADYQQEESPETRKEFSAEEKVDSDELVCDNPKALVPHQEFASHVKISPTHDHGKDSTDPGLEKNTGSSTDRDAALARVELERRLALIKAWEDNEKTKADNKAYKKLSAVDAWENTKRALVEAEMKQIEEKFERKKAECGEKMKNKMAMIHKEAQEKRASVEAHFGKQVVMVEKAAAHFRATGKTPKRLFACFSC